MLTFIDLNEYNGKLFNDLGLDHLAVKNYSKALYYFTKAIELKPEVGLYHFNRASLYWKIESLTLAFIDWEKADSLGFSDAKILLEKYSNYRLTQLAFKNRLEKGVNLLNEFKIDYLFHLTHIDNLPNIIKYGLLSHKGAYSKNLNVRDISDNEVNLRRNKIHHLVPFYFNPKNPMLYKRKVIQDQIIILCFHRHLLLNDYVIFSDGNGASNPTKFYNHLEDLSKLDWSILNSEYWSDFKDGKRIRCAEILIPDIVPTSKIEKIICYSNRTKNLIESINNTGKFLIDINSSFYF